MKDKPKKKKILWQSPIGQIRKGHVGRYVQVAFDDVGRLDGILVGFDKTKDSEPSHSVFTFVDGIIQSVSPSQIIWMGDFVPAPTLKKI